MNAHAAHNDPRAPHPIVGLAMDSAFAADLLDPRTPGTATEFGRGVDAAGIDFLLIGRDRLVAEGSDESTLDPTVAATVLARHTRRTGLVVTAAPGRDHPYNVARRLASLDHGSRGRVGWLVGTADDAVPHSAAVWTGADPLEAAVDAVAVARSLWRSWPADSIVDDRQRGVFARSDRIAYIDHDGAYRVSGPLNVVEPPQSQLPVFWAPRGERELQAARRVADVVVVRDEDAAGRYRAAAPDPVREQALLVDVQWETGIGDRRTLTSSDGVLVHGATSDTWPDVLASIARPAAEGPGVTLRDLVGLPSPDLASPGVRFAFSVS
ncbi:LLM class flavin-dependent oxidoreductase [Rhodococcus sp. NPDC003318]|uniref:LLM class flavin-dependent oxidoreductase n=1 Tax=Rhodococcus sp. NPDC003318 TaxID=3364503 RepID=UPI0036806B99